MAVQVARVRSYATAPSRPPPPSSAASTAHPGSAAPANPAHNSSSGKAFPDASPRAVAYWLLGSAASVFGIVVFGGLTRLTESG